MSGKIYIDTSGGFNPKNWLEEFAKKIENIYGAWHRRPNGLDLGQQEYWASIGPDSMPFAWVRYKRELIFKFHLLSNEK